MSFVDTVLQEEFIELLDAYLIARGNYIGVTVECSKYFDCDLPHINDSESRILFVRDLNRKVDDVTYKLYAAKSKLFNFIISHADRIHYGDGVDSD